MRTRKIPDGDPTRDLRLLRLLPDERTTAWVRDGDGLIGWGEAARLHARGPDRFAVADDWWQRQRERMEIDDAVQLPGTGPVAFTSMAFADVPGDSVLVVPRVVIGQRDGVRWLTTIGTETDPIDDVEPRSAPRQPGTVRYSDGQLPTTRYRQLVADAVHRMDGPGGIDKVVLAHDLIATTSEPLDTRFLLHNLAERYPSCWTFEVDGLVGATPELLLERTGRQVRSRVLAGTTWPRDGRSADELAAQLRSSTKDRSEHAYATESLADALRPFCDRMSVPDTPEVLRLRNVMHLASDVWGLLAEPRSEDGTASLFRMAEAVHPTAAVGGTPTEDAVPMIRELERMDRGRYAGPVGWIDGEGNGVLGLALRCAQVQDDTPGRDGTGERDGGRIGEPAPAEEDPGVGDDPGVGGDRGAEGGAEPAVPTTGRGSRVRLFAGCGVVTDSDPDTEVAEAEAKLIPIREALEGVR
ncbi:isochorismate synthase [Parasphingorhabdus pacifica]